MLCFILKPSSAKTFHLLQIAFVFFLQTVCAQKLPQYIDFKEITPKYCYLDSLISLEASASSGLPLIFELTKGYGTIVGTTLIPLQAGHFEIRASQPGNSIYKEADVIYRTFNLVTNFNLVSEYDLIFFKNKICEDDTLTIFLKSIPGVNARWLLPNNLKRETLSLRILSVTSQYTGNYILNLYEKSCKLLDDTFKIDVISKPIVQISVINQPIYTTSGILSIDVLPKGGELFLNNQKVTSVNTALLTIGAYNLSYFYTDKNQCKNSASITFEVITKPVSEIITMSDSSLVIYNYITPNNDGFNDCLVIDNFNIFKQASIIIYDRWGMQVFKAKSDYANDWSPTELTNGNYLYEVVTSNNEIIKKGTITIVR